VAAADAGHAPVFARGPALDDDVDVMDALEQLGRQEGDRFADELAEVSAFQG